MMRYLTAGESHGSSLTAILEGIPAGLKIDEEDINIDLARRQVGYGRGQRMKIEKDRVRITSGIRWGKTMGSPVSMVIENKDWERWKEEMSISSEFDGRSTRLTRPRPGHADLSGVIKYNTRDMRNVLERASARETACRVAVGAVTKCLLKEFDIQIMSHVTEIGGVKSNIENLDLKELRRRVETSDLRCADSGAERKIKTKIDDAKARGDSLGGTFEVIVTGVPIGLGTYTQWDKKLDGRIAKALMSIQAIKGVEIGLGFEYAGRSGSQVHDEICYRFEPEERKEAAVLPRDMRNLKNKPQMGFFRKTNNAGGIEGGVSNGEPIVARAVMKPIPTLLTPLTSVDIDTKEIFEASVERSDTCAVAAAGVIGEAVVAIEIADAFMEKFGGDSIEEVKRNYEGYLKYVKNF
ncbi:MAG: chorismate synthase [Thermodesulfobacteriota bacterium]|nr:chorismate synthase [Thermodesulfobacteriota bacterium]